MHLYLLILCCFAIGHIQFQIEFGGNSFFSLSLSLSPTICIYPLYTPLPAHRALLRDRANPVLYRVKREPTLLPDPLAGAPRPPVRQKAKPQLVKSLKRQFYSEFTL